MTLKQFTHGVLCIVFGLCVAVACGNDPGPDGMDDVETDKPADTSDDDFGVVKDSDDKKPVDTATEPTVEDTATEPEVIDTETESGTPCDTDMLDPFTGLCWHVVIDIEQGKGWPLTSDYATAKQTCDDLVLNEYDDWRLPTIDEHRANLSLDCTYTTLSGPCDVRIDCDFYPFLDTCTEFTKTWEERDVDACGSCNWLGSECKWNIPLSDICGGSFWSSTEITYETSTAYYRMGYSNGYLAKSGSWDNSVACVRQEQDMDEDEAPVVEILPDEDGGCDADKNTICSVLKGADFGSGDDLLGWYFDGETCVEASGDSAKASEFCLYSNDVECAKGCAAEDKCNPKRLDRELLTFYYEEPKVWGDEVDDIWGGYLCADDAQKDTLDGMYDDEIKWFATEPAPCSAGNRRGDFLFPKDNDPDFPRTYADLDQDEFRQLCAYTLLNWVEFVRGVHLF